jgi:hypothetical protein
MSADYLPQTRSSTAAFPGRPLPKSSSVDEWEDAEDSEQEDHEILSPYYHRALAEQYKEVVAPFQGQWESSDEEEKAKELPLVPAPLFWKNRQRELYPSRVGHFLTKDDEGIRSQQLELRSNKKNNKSKSIFASGVPLKLVLASQLKNKNEGNQRQGNSKTLKISRSLFHHKRHASVKRSSLNRAPSQRAARPNFRRHRGKAFHQPPLTLQLPSIAFRSQLSMTPRSITVKSAAAPPTNTLLHSPPEPPIQRGINKRSELSRQSPDGYGLEDPATLIDEMLAESPLSLGHTPPYYGQGHIVQKDMQPHRAKDTYQADSSPLEELHHFSKHPNSSTAFPRSLERRPTHALKPHALPRSEIRNPISSPALKTPGTASKAIHTVIDRARSSIGHSKSASSFNFAKSMESSVTFDTIGIPYLEVDAADGVSKHEQARPLTSSSSLKQRSKFIQKALEVKREMERQKNRKALKASIKLVGEADPNKVDVDRSRRETFGAGWV